MEMIPIMIGVSLFLGGLAVVAVIWGLSRNQFDDPDKAVSMALYDDAPPPGDEDKTSKERIEGD